MTRLIIASSPTGLPMGPEVYQQAITSRASEALAVEDPHREWSVERTIVRSIRSSSPGNRRLPMTWVQGASAGARRAVGRLLYPRAAVIHRMTLELPPPPGAHVVTLHDVISWKYPDESRPVPAAVEELRRADAVVCVSSFTAGEAADLLGLDNLHVVPNGVDSRFFDAEPLTPAQLGELGLERPYVLATGGATTRKNLEGLARAWPQIHRERPGLALVLAGPEHPRRTALFRGLPEVHLTGHVPSRYLPGLVATAEALVVPSLYEGFGLPALEAMAARTPVVAADTSALPEVVGDAGILVQPSPTGIVEGVLHATSGHPSVSEGVQRARGRAARFTWERSARGHAAVWASVAP